MPLLREYALLEAGLTGVADPQVATDRLDAIRVVAGGEALLSSVRDRAQLVVLAYQTGFARSPS